MVSPAQQALKLDVPTDFGPVDDAILVFFATKRPGDVFHSGELVEFVLAALRAEKLPPPADGTISRRLRNLRCPQDLTQPSRLEYDVLNKARSLYIVTSFPRCSHGHNLDGSRVLRCALAPGHPGRHLAYFWEIDKATGQGGCGEVRW